MQHNDVVGANTPEDCPRNRYAAPQTLRRYRKLFPLGIEHFHRQNAYPPTGVPWVPAQSPYRNEDLDRHLDPSEDFWIGSRAPQDMRGPITHFLILDLDAKDDPDAPFDRLDRIVSLFGVEPLVFTSPGGGLHAFWFFDEPVRLVNLTHGGRSHTRGLVPGLLRVALREAPGQGIVEVFPQAGRIIRWPLGNRQDLVDRASRSVVVGLSPEEKLDATERYLEDGNRLTFRYLKELAAANKDEFNFVSALEPDGSQPTPAGDTVSAWNLGLTEPGSRDRTVWALATTLVQTPEALGLTADADPAVELANWMRTKHNGFSETLASLDADDEWFDIEAERLVYAARGGRRTVGRSSIDPTLLTGDEVEWILTMSEAIEVEPSWARFNFERQTYAILRKGKSVARYNRTSPDDDGVYLVEIHSDWWKQIPGLKNFRSRADFQMKLGIADFCHPHADPSWKGKRARVYAMRLDFEGERFEPGFPLEYLAAAAEVMGVDRVILEYEYMIGLAFDRDELAQRYGRWTAHRLHEQFHTAIDTMADIVLGGSDHVVA